jgi:DNA modification methylase
MTSLPATNLYHDIILCGDALAELRRLPDNLVDCIVTSPPYFGQRRYHSDDEIGREATPQEYVTRLTDVFREAQRVLNPSGTLWLVLGDKYDRGRLLGMPWRVALSLMDDGWRLRSEVIWHKPNAMPSAATNRPTVDHEHVFFFARSARSYYDADAVREPHVTFSEQSRMKGGRKHFHRRGATPEAGKNGGAINLHDGRWDQAFHPQGRNKRTVWSIPLSKFRDAHFAVFPERLAETCIAAGCPPGGLVLDPFLGSGTTAVAAEKLGRRYLGIDCVPEYCEMARTRIAVAGTTSSPPDFHEENRSI